jgi:hypothetical protein
LEASALSSSFHQNVINTQQTAILLWQRVRESNPHWFPVFHRCFPLGIVQNNALTRNHFVLNCPEI